MTIFHSKVWSVALVLGLFACGSEPGASKGAASGGSAGVDAATGRGAGGEPRVDGGTGSAGVAGDGGAAGSGGAAGNAGAAGAAGGGGSAGNGGSGGAAIGADVAIVSITDSPDPIPALELLEYEVTATNHGPNPAPSLLITFDLPASVTFLGAAAACVGGNGFGQCSLGALAPGASTKLKVTVRPKQSGNISTTVAAGGGTADPNPQNNIAIATTTVE